MRSATAMPVSLPDPTADNSAGWALFLDVDGTLTDIAITPNAVIVPPILPEILDSWRLRLSGALALISGRSLAQIDRLFHPHRYDAAGSHGHEWRYGGTTQLAGPDRSADIAAVIPFAESQVLAFPGLALERKPHSLVIHYRAAPDRRRDAVLVADRILTRLGPGFRSVSGKAVAEIMVDGTDKAAAICRLMTCPAYRGRMPVFAGDDISDEAGFAVVNRLGGISIHVGNNPNTRAKAVVPTPASLRDWLSSARSLHIPRL